MISRLKAAWKWLRTCDRLAYHAPGVACGFDGATVTSHCRKCGKRIGQDSQGNWFSFTHQDPEEA